jgi:hypothetical protein
VTARPGDHADFRAAPLLASPITFAADHVGKFVADLVRMDVANGGWARRRSASRRRFVGNDAKMQMHQ